MLVVDIHHWLEDGELPHHNLRLRRRVLRIARFIEYGGPIGVGESRETLMECRRRPGREPCPGLIWVTKRGAPDFEILAYCLVCREREAAIYNWADTDWAEGMMEPVPPELGVTEGS